MKKMLLLVSVMTLSLSAMNFDDLNSDTEDSVPKNLVKQLCRLCNEYKNETDLSAHMQNVHHVCPKCDQQCETSERLRIHVLIHASKTKPHGSIYNWN